jgi:hypothetical protein
MLQRKNDRLIEREREAHTHTSTHPEYSSSFHGDLSNEGSSPADWHIFEKEYAFTPKRKQTENCIPCHEYATNRQVEVEKLALF